MLDRWQRFVFGGDAAKFFCDVADKKWEAIKDENRKLSRDDDLAEQT